MVIVKIIVLIMLSTPVAFANEIQKAFKSRDYGRVASTYLANKDKPYKEKDYVVISYSLRKQGYFREDIKVVYGLIKRFYDKDHTKILRSIKSGETLDSDEVAEPLKIHYWNLFNDYANILRQYQTKSQTLSTDHRHFRAFAKILSEVEFREGKVDKTVDSITAHLQYLDDKIYHFKTSFSFLYVSWQQEANLEGPAGNIALVITNRGFCTGGEMGLENYLFHFYLDGCLLYGSGGVKNTERSGPDYQQSNLPAYGLKGGPGASVIVSSSGSRIGIKIPVLYSLQEITNPDQAGYSVSGNANISILTTLYSRWQFDKWYLQTEFGKYVQEEESFWGLGIGRIF
ncbi:MAG TPA: hypothetical protein VNJ08_08555 [Bacteriovoracaceae bacterium]|nr:hypothetical protein [Bacteriovoracaceae bacterium]